MTGRRPLSLVPAAACVALALAAGACNRDSATTGPSGVVGKDFAANLRVVSGDQQLGGLGSALTQPIVVKVVDAGGQPVQGATVTFSVRAGGGSINPAANVSNAAGLVSSTWTMGTTLGAGKVVALLTNNFVLDSATFTATAVVGGAAVFTKVSGDAQTTNAGRQLGAPLVVKVQDPYGNNVSGVKVTWAPGVLNGTVSFVTDTTAADGSASASWTLGTGAVVQTLSATIPGKAPLTFTATVTADTGRVLTVTSGQSPVQTATGGTPLGTALGLRLTDQYGNPISGATVTWTDSVAGGGSVSTILGTTSATGDATTTWTLGRRAGGQYLRAKLTGRTETAVFTANSTVSLSDVNVGNFASCGLATDGTAMCWGYGADGQLGKLTNTRNTNAISTSVSPTDTLAGPFLTFRSLNVGKNHACGITIGRDLYCWGASNVLQLGAASAGGTPGKWKGDLGWSSVSAGEFNTCALTPTGALYCSGVNDQGQIGNGTVTAAGVGGVVVTQVVSAGIVDTLFSAVAVGQSHVCAIPRSPGAQVPRCWGFNTSGQVGDGSLPAITRRLVPTSISTGVGFPTAYDSTSLAAGNSHTCAIATAGGTVGGTYCWGGNGFGQLGDGSTVNRNQPTLVSGGLAFVQLSAGAYHTCGLTASGSAYCWGRNSSGQLGNGTTTQSSVPVAIATPAFRAISAGELFTCGVVGVPAPSGGTTSTAAAVYCWGDNEYGQVGNTTVPAVNNSPRLTPIKISFVP